MYVLGSSEVNRYNPRPLTGLYGSRGFGIRYPSPFFDVAQQFLPENVHQLMTWCRYYFLTNPIVNAACSKMAEYPVTSLMYETEDAKLQDLYSKLEKHLRLRQFQVEVGLDYFVYGNAFVSIFFPFVRFLQCPKCGERYRADKNRSLYKWKNGRFFLSCDKCHNEGYAREIDVYIRSPRDIRLIRWNPENIEIKHNEATGKSTYFYKIPRRILNDIKIGDRDTLETLPLEFLQAARKSRALLFDQANLYHLKRPTIAQKDQGWGTPLIYPLLKDAFYMQVMKKAQESLLMEHVVPLRIIFPGPSTGGNEGPYGSYSLRNWKNKIDAELNLWKRDHNYIPILPVNIGFQQVGGTAKALILHQEFRLHAEQMLAGAGIPVEFVFGGLQWCLRDDSLLFTDKGLLSLAETSPETEGLSARSDLRIVTHEGVSDIALTHRTGKRKVTHLKTHLGLDSHPSPQHRWRVLTPSLEQGWKRTSELVPGDRIMVRYGANLWPQEPLSVGEHVNAARAQELKRDASGRYPVSFPNRLTSSLARILGYMAAEGSTTEENRVSLNNTDLDLLEDMQDCVEDTFGYRPKLAESNGQHFGNKQQWCLEIGRRQAATFLQSILGKKYSAEKEVPALIRMAPKRYVREFLSAYFEGDGGVEDVDEKQTVYCGSKSEKLLKQIQLLLLNMGIVSSRYEDPSTGMWSLSIRGHHVDLFAREIGFISERKMDVLSRRTPTAEIHISDRIPYVKDKLDVFRRQWFGGNNSWVQDEAPEVPNQDWFTVAEVAAVLNRSKHSVYLAVRGERLLAHREGQKLQISREALVSYLSESGIHRHVSVPCRGAWGATQRNLRNADLSFVWEKDPILASRIEALIRDDVLWDEVVEVSESEEEANMCDLTVRRDHSFAADGLISHNSGTNTSLRALENMFTGYNMQRHELINDFILGGVAAFLGWPRVQSRFDRFKMADDLQRSMFMMQLNQAQKISDRTLISDIGLDFDKETERMDEELKRQLSVQRKTQVAGADIQGAASLRTARYQAKGMELQTKAQLQAQMEAQQQGMGGDPNAQQPEQDQQAQGDPNQEFAPQNPEDGAQPNSSGVPAGMESPLQPGQGGIDLTYIAQKAASYLKQVREEGGPEMMYKEMERLQTQNPALYKMVLPLMNDSGSQLNPMDGMKSPAPAGTAQTDPSRTIG